MGLPLTLKTLTAQTLKLGNGDVHGHGCFSLGSLPPTLCYGNSHRNHDIGFMTITTPSSYFHSLTLTLNSNPKRTSSTIRYLSFLFFGFINFFFFMFLEWLNLNNNGVLDVSQQVLMNQKPEEIYWIMLSTSLPICQVEEVLGLCL